MTWSFRDAWVILQLHILDAIGKILIYAP
uniref:Uncharacterized protein n=1 Tax=Rhizophora mucronata TaxID=61149 RepID=A0A2P2J309_RHIMU